MRITLSTEPLYTQREVNSLLCDYHGMEYVLGVLAEVENGNKPKESLGGGDREYLCDRLKTAKKNGLHQIWPWGTDICQNVEELLKKYCPDKL